MPDLYDEYKPLRNLLRQYNLQQSLEDIWMLASHLNGGKALPLFFGDGKPDKVRDYLFLWDLPILQREIVLNATPKGIRRLNTFHSLGTVINMVRRVEETASSLFINSGAGPDHALASLHATIHRQFPWQHQRVAQSLIRYLKLYGSEEIGVVLKREAGVSIHEWFFLGMAVGGHLSKHPGINATQTYQAFGIENNRSSPFFGKLSISINELRDKTLALQSYDADWVHTWNPIEATPLIELDTASPHLLHCPLPELFLRRIGPGLFYDLTQKKGFDNPYGKSFESYIGEVVHATYGANQYKLLDQVQYRDGLNKKHGTDWVLVDDGANLFIECKTKRMNWNAKLSFDRNRLLAQLKYLATAFVQLYKNIGDAKLGKTDWQVNDRPIYPLVVTLEDWILFGPVVKSLLDGEVRAKMLEAGLEISILQTMPYCVMSAAEFESACPVWAVVGIREFFERRHHPEYVEWLVQDMACDAFPEAWKARPEVLFKEDWLNAFPNKVGPLHQAFPSM